MIISSLGEIGSLIRAVLLFIVTVSHRESSAVGSSANAARISRNIGFCPGCTGNTTCSPLNTIGIPA